MRAVALLRGVNLGRRQLKMAELRAAVESLGHTGVETYLQSGNVVFTPTGRAGPGSGDAISAALHEQVGLHVNVLIRTGTQIAAVVAANPYPVDDPTKVVVSFLASPADASGARALDLDEFAPETLTVHGAEIYLHLPDGQARSKLAAALAKQKTPGSASATTRNWRTVVALAELTAR